MNIDIIVQARLGSTRLPGKVLKPIMGRPMIEYTLESMLRVTGVQRVILATPKDDLELRRVAQHFAGRVKWFGGDEKDVASRFLALSYYCDAFVRVCGDSPVLDWRLIEGNLFFLNNSRMVSNIWGGFPSGQQFEIVDCEFFRQHRPVLSPEHVLPPLYLKAGNDLMQVLATPESPNPPLVVDTQEDFDRMTKVIEKANGRPWEFTWRQLQDFARETCPNQSN